MVKRPGFIQFLIFTELLCLQSPRASAQAPAAAVDPSVQIFTAQNGLPINPFTAFPDRPLNVSVSLAVGYDSRVNTATSSERSSYFTSDALNLHYSFGTPRTSGDVSAHTAISYYAREAGSRIRPDLSFSLRLSHGISERLTLSGSAVVRYRFEPDFSNDDSLNRQSGKKNYLSASGSISASYQLLARWSNVLSYSLSTIQYGDTRTEFDDTGARSRNRFTHSFSEQLRFHLSPFTTIFGQYGLALVRYDMAEFDSTIHTFSLGVDQTIGPHLRANVSAGAQLRDSVQSETTSITPYAAATVNYVVGETTTLSFNARYSTQESNRIQPRSVQRFSMGLVATHGLTARISSSLSVFYRHDANEQTSSTVFARPDDDSVDIGLQLSYAISARISAHLSYNRTDVLSEEERRSYSRNRYSGGVAVSF